MKVLVQQTLASPRGWDELDLRPTGAGARRWRNLAKRPVPVGGEKLDAPGYVMDLCVQGVSLRGADHYAVVPLEDGSGGVRVWRWLDDLADPETDYAHGQVWEFRPGWADRILHFPDGSSIRHQGPDQRVTFYAADMVTHRPYAPRECGGLPVGLLPWSQWPAPPEDAVRHGVWVDLPLLDKHLKAQGPVHWRDWTAGP